MSLPKSFLSLAPLKPPVVLLSASVPSAERAARYRRTPQTHLEVEAAVISMVRATLSAGGSMVFGGHPSISPLVATVATEYFGPTSREKGFAPEHIRVYQSVAFRGSLPDETLSLLRLGHVYIRWTAAIAGERFSSDLPEDQPFCPQSLTEMRRLMIEESRPDALVCIGGMEGVEKEFEAFDAWRRTHSSPRPVYVIAATGGAAELLARAGEGRVKVIDREIQGRLSKLRTQPRREGVTPYPLIMQTLIGELLH